MNEIIEIDKTKEIDSFSKIDLLAILLGSGAKVKNARQLSEQIIKKHDKNFLNLEVSDLIEIPGIGKTKALQIVSAITLVKKFYEDNDNLDFDVDYVASNDQLTIFDLLGIDKPNYDIKINKSRKTYYHKYKTKDNYFQLQNRRYLGNKFKLLGFIEDIVEARCGEVNSFCDIFAGTGVVGERFNRPEIKIISNDFLHFNYICLKTFIGTYYYDEVNVKKKIDYLNALEEVENYFLEYFSDTYFTFENAKKIGTIREEINNIADNENEKIFYYVLFCMQ